MPSPWLRTRIQRVNLADHLALVVNELPVVFFSDAGLAQGFHELIRPVRAAAALSYSAIPPYMASG